MAGSSGSIAKNTTFLTIASIVQKIISFAYYGYLASFYGEATMGKYSFALLLTGVFSIFMDFGLGPLLTREGSKKEEKLQEYVQRLWSVKLVLMVIVLGALVLTILGADALFEKVDAVDVQLVLLGGIVITLDTIIFTFYSIFRAIKQMFWEAIAIVIYQAVILGVGITAIHFGLPIHYIIAALITGSAVQLVFLYVMLKVRTKVKFRFRYKKSEFKKLLFMAAPFAIAGLIFRLNGSIDSFMLKIMAGDSSVGWYSLAFKLAFALTVLPGAFATSYFPAVSHHFIHAKEKLHTVFENGMVYMCIISFPIMAGVFILGDDIIRQFWDEAWMASVEPLWIFMIALPFVFMNYPIGNFLNAVEKQRLNTVNMFIALVFNIIVNAILVPYYTFNGAAIAVCVSSIALVILGLPWVYKIAPFRIGFLFSKAARIGLAAGIMAAVLYFVQYNYPLFVLVPLGGVLYFAAAFITGGLTRQEVNALTSAIIRKRQ